MRSCRWVVVVLSMVQLCQARSRHRQVTVEVAAGYEDCFYVENVKAGLVMDLEYQVIGSSAATGQNDITVRVQSPHPRSVPSCQCTANIPTEQHLQFSVVYGLRKVAINLQMQINGLVY